MKKYYLALLLFSSLIGFASSPGEEPDPESQNPASQELVKVNRCLNRCSERQRNSCRCVTGFCGAFLLGGAALVGVFANVGLLRAGIDLALDKIVSGQ